MLVQQVMERTFRTMGLHPTYLEAFKATHEQILTGDGPISLVDRHHFALMAVARHSCMELLNVYEEDLTSACINNEDLVMKSKIRRLDKINKLLAHRPWAIKGNHIKELLQGGEDGTNKWNLNQLVVAMVYLCHFHALASFVLGCGLTNEPPVIPSQSPNNSEDNQDIANQCTETVEVGEQEAEKVTNIIKKMEDLMAHEDEELELDEVARRFETVKAHEIREPDSISLTSSRSKSPELDNIKMIDPAKYTDTLDFQYVDFVKRTKPEESPTFRETDFGWIDYAFTVMSNFGGEDLARRFDEKFSVITNLTYRNIGKIEAVDTRLFRMAVHRYAQCLFGIRHDDYDYSQINILLPRNLKTYIKTFCCFPERCTLEGYEAIMADFRNSEKVHVCLLVCEARLQAELLYGLRAVSEHYNFQA